MEKKTHYVAVDKNGTQRNIESWKEADILLLLETLFQKRGDLYTMLQDHIISDCKQMGMVGIQCEEPPPTAVDNKCMEKNCQRSSFKSVLCDAQLEMLANLMNEIGFVEHPLIVTKDYMAAFFRCEQTGLKVRNLRLFCAMMSALANYGFIGRYWQAPIYKYQLLVAYKKDGYIGRSDLTTAHHAINNVMMDERVEKIIKTVKKLRELEDADVSV